MLARDLPCVVGLSPPCTLFCQLQALRKSKIDSNDWKNAVNKGRSFYFERPMRASSWTVTDFADWMMCNHVETVLLHMYAFNLTARAEFEEGLVLKPTRILTNMPCLAERQ